MPDAGQALSIIYQAVDELNEQLPPDDRLEPSPDTPLLGDAGMLDSVQLVNLIVTTEELLFEAYDRRISVADDRAFSRARSPFLTIGSFAAYVDELLRKEAVG
jgi:acyl carrier protein